MGPPMLKSQLQNLVSNLLFPGKKKHLENKGSTVDNGETHLLWQYLSDHCVVESKLIKQMSLT